jgi:hypothetical protein
MQLRLADSLAIGQIDEHFALRRRQAEHTGIAPAGSGSLLVHVGASCLFARFVGHSKNAFRKQLLRYNQASDEQNNSDAHNRGTENKQSHYCIPQ